MRDIWTTKFILPEHREAMHLYEKERHKKERPIFDSQQLEEFDYIIREAYQGRKMVKVLVYGEYEDLEKKGIITKIEPNYIALEYEGDFDIIRLKDILNIFIINK